MVINFYYDPPIYNFLKTNDIPNEGEIVYFYNSDGIWFGVIAAVYHDGVEIELYMPDAKKKVKVDNVEYNYNDAPNKTKPIKLPANKKKKAEILSGSAAPHVWYEGTVEPPKIEDKDALYEMIKNRILIPNSEIDYSYYDMIETEKNEIQYVKRRLSTSMMYHSHYDSFRFINWKNLFFTYNDAKEYVDALNKEKERQAQLTDEEWAKEECANTLVKFINYYVRVQDVDVASQIHKKIMEQIEKFLQKKNLDWYDVEFRWISSGLEYKKCKNSKWTALAPAIDDELHEGLIEFLGQFD